MKKINQISNDNPTLSVGEIIDIFQKEYTPLPRKPTKPFLMTTTSTEEQIGRYRLRLSAYEQEKKRYDETIAKCKKEAIDRDKQIWDYLFHKSGAYQHVPYLFHTNIKKHAWEKGHSYGYQQVFVELSEIVNIFIIEN